VSIIDEIIGISQFKLLEGANALAAPKSMFMIKYILG